MDVGEVIAGRFVLEALCGEGGMGQVFRARDRETGELVAIKTLHGSSFERFAREADVLASIAHAAIVRYLTHGRADDGRPFLAMEWLAGEDLETRLARGRLGVEDTLALATRVASALAHGHARGIVHRDVKPANIFLPGGDVASAKILDFGLARMRDAPRATVTGVVLGTVGYMAPEQARGERDVGPEADVFSLGCVLFECLAGQPAFAGDHAIAVLAKVLLASPPQLASFVPAVPAALDALVTSMIAKERAARPADASALLGPLARIAVAGSPATVRLSSGGLTAHEQQLASVALLAPVALELVETVGSDAWLATRWDIAALVERHGGKLEMLPGGTLVATVPGTGSVREKAQQAARCALAMQTAATGVRVVLATGRRVEGHALPIGEVIDRCVRMLRQNGEVRSSAFVRVDETTARLLDAGFEIERDDGGHVLVRERGAETARPERRACVGRERELGTLTALFDECVDGPAACAAMLVGPSGIGKSRLAAELLARAPRERGAAIWSVAADPVSAGSPFGLVARAIRHAAALRGDEPAEQQRDRLLARAGRHLPPDEASRVADGLADLCGLPAARSGERPAHHGEAARKAWDDLIAAECAAGPLVIVIEDVHWADFSSVGLLDATLRARESSPFFLLATARPDVFDVFPNLWSERGLHEIRVVGLGRRACEQLVRARLGSRATAETLAAVLDRAGGNAFYLEELMRAVEDGRHDAIPETVVGMVQARLRGLPAETRRVLRAASIFGPSFVTSGVVALLGGDAERPAAIACLDDLVQREVIVPDADPRRSGDAHAFAHALVREAAYAMLTEEDRVLGHRLAGEWLLTRDLVSPALLAHHFDHADDAQRAAHFHELSANEALTAGDTRGALACAERAMARGAEGEARGRLGALAADAHFQRGELEVAERLGLEALALLPTGTPRWYQASRAVMARKISRFGRP